MHASQQELHVWIRETETVGRGWFRQKEDRYKPGREYAWRHLDVLNLTTVLHVMRQPEAEVLPFGWMGSVGGEFTRDFEQLLYRYLLAGVDMATICELCQVPVAKLWRFKYQLDHGGTTINEDGELAAASATGLSVEPSTSGHAVRRAPEARAQLPSIESEIWQKIAGGQIHLQTSMLGLKLLLKKIHQQYAMNPSLDGRALKIAELHRFFEKNERSLQREISQVIHLL